MDIASILRKIPQEDLEQINALFSTIFKSDHGTYTLFGDKPVSLSGHFTLTPWENTMERIDCYGGLFWKRWEVWEKYKHLFPFQSYLVLKEPSRFSKISNIIIINKKEFINTINQHEYYKSTRRFV